MATVDYNVPLITNISVAKAFLSAINQKSLESLEIIKKTIIDRESTLCKTLKFKT